MINPELYCPKLRNQNKNIINFLAKWLYVLTEMSFCHIRKRLPDKIRYQAYDKLTVNQKQRIYNDLALSYTRGLWEPKTRLSRKEAVDFIYDLTGVKS